MNSYACRRFTAPSRVRRRPRLFQDLFLQLQLGDLPAQPDQFGPLVSAELTGLPAGAFLAQLVDPVAQRLMIDAQLPGHIAGCCGRNPAPALRPGAETPRGACSVEPTRFLLLARMPSLEVSGLKGSLQAVPCPPARPEQQESEPQSAVGRRIDADPHGVPRAIGARVSREPGRGWLPSWPAGAGRRRRRSRPGR
jgi:hypothetical protein